MQYYIKINTTSTPPITKPASLLCVAQQAMGILGRTTPYPSLTSSSARSERVQTVVDMVTKLGMENTDCRTRSMGDGVITWYGVTQTNNNRL